MRLRHVLSAMLMTAASLVAAQGFAQSTDGRVAGVVRDSSGAAVPGASLTVTNDQTGASQSAVSGPDGSYSVTGLAAGDYTVEVQLRSFGTAKHKVRVVSGGVGTADFTLAAKLEEEVFVTGSRTAPRSTTESMAPIDVLSAREFEGLTGADLSDQVRTLVPSYNVNTQPISDAATIVRPASLRNLAPDHTLVLINGERRHRAAVIYWLGNGVADGAQGPDISAIPSIALRQVEVLRDGASAQYGSDAIAGVMNFMLKDSRKGGAIELRGGTYRDGGGDAFSIAGNTGLPLGPHGFANITAEYAGSDPTDRSVQRDDAALLVSGGNTQVKDPAQIWGSPKIEDDFKLWVNSGYLFGGGQQLYALGNYVTKKVTGGFYYRNPNTRGGVFSSDGGATLLIGDVLDARDGVRDGSAKCPKVTVTDGRPDPVALARVFADPNCFSYQEMFPGGFTPQFGGDVRDYSLVAGVRGLNKGVSWNLSGGYGSNEVDFFIFNTVNASLGPDSPTSFNPGLYKQDEVNVNLRLGYPLNKTVHLAGGVEWRDEKFTIGVGQRESWVNGPFAEQGFSAASNGFPGFSPLSEGSWSRSNFAGYLDLEAGRGSDWTLGTAARFEHFADFGSTLNGKLAGRYAINANVALRASVSTGFRAPTPGQSNAYNVSTQFDLALGDLVNNGTIPATSPVAALRGGKPLVAEKSVNYSMGAVVRAGKVHLTTDLFRIDMRDRLAVTQNFALNEAEVEGLLREGITSARSIQNFRFFTNDFETSTQGIDVVATYTAGATDVHLLFNHTQTEVTDFNPDTLAESRIQQLEEALPKTRASLSLTRSINNLRLLGRVSTFSGWYDFDDSYSYDGGHVLVDLEATYKWKKGITIVAGGQNVFNHYPDENPGARAGVGNLYSQYAPFGFNGAFWYGRIKYEF
ncbi:MAG TPA: TonB-dependent receptor [Vicinamibacteria bacterium]|nr:TonB-dependent receptor [Vicinamibacteria bacterium]